MLGWRKGFDKAVIFLNLGIPKETMPLSLKPDHVGGRAQQTDGLTSGEEGREGLQINGF